MWGNWKCPDCGEEWRGSIGYMTYYLLPNDDYNNRINERLRAICGCTGKHITKELMDEMKVFTIMKKGKENEDS